MAVHSLLRVVAAASAAALVAGAVVPEPEPIVSALAADDQCNADDAECALNALQRRVKTKGHFAASLAAAVGDGDVEVVSDAGAGAGSCKSFGCQGYLATRPCQCHDGCESMGNCCTDYAAVCKKAGQSGGCYHTGNAYDLDWKAEGTTFFDEFTFVTQDDVHGAQAYVQLEEAKKRGVVTTTNSTAQLRIGDIRPASYAGEAQKRYSANIHTNKAWDPKKGVLFVMSYKHVPWGCGVWPGFWAMHSNEVWPAGGELDMMEYANMEPNKASFHIAGSCKLNRVNTDKCVPSGSFHGFMPYNCETDYYHDKFGCMPPQLRANGKDWAQRPGVVAAEWSDRMVTIFRIPADQVPADLAADKPRPAEWSKFAIAYFEFEPGCKLGPQELILNIQLCGDWAGASWESAGSTCAMQTGFYQASGRCVHGLSQPRDCCTQYVVSGKGGAFLKENAYFDVNYIKVFTANGHSGTPSGTYMRGGRPLK